MRTLISCGGQLAGDATAAPVTLPQWPALSTQSGVTSVPVQRNGPKVISATAGYSPGLAFASAHYRGGRSGGRAEQRGGGHGDGKNPADRCSCVLQRTERR